MKRPVLGDATLCRLVGAAFVVGALAACGGKSTPGPGEVARQYVNALGTRDYAGACGHLARSAKQDVARYVARAFPELKSGGCEMVIQAAVGLASDAELAALRAFEIQEVTRDERRAVVRLDARAEPVDLVQEDGAWKIARLEFTG